LNLLFSQGSNAQNDFRSYIYDQPIELLKGFTLRYKAANVLLKNRDVKELLRYDDRALAGFTTGQTLDVMGGIVGFGGGFMVGWAVGGYLAVPKSNRYGQRTSSSAQMDWTVLGIGGGLIAASAILSALGRYAKIDAIETYNSKFKSARVNTQAPQVIFAEEGIGIGIRF